jgi:hypothetical protein
MKLQKFNEFKKINEMVSKLQFKNTFAQASQTLQAIEDFYMLKTRSYIVSSAGTLELEMFSNSVGDESEQREIVLEMLQSVAYKQTIHSLKIVEQTKNQTILLVVIMF